MIEIGYNKLVSIKGKPEGQKGDSKMNKQEIAEKIATLKAAKEHFNMMAYMAKMVGRTGEAKQYKKQVKQINDKIAYLEFCFAQ